MIWQLVSQHLNAGPDETVKFSRLESLFMTDARVLYTSTTDWYKQWNRLQEIGKKLVYYKHFVPKFTKSSPPIHADLQKVIQHAAFSSFTYALAFLPFVKSWS